MIDHKNIREFANYKCFDCGAIIFGYELDWFPDEPDLIICPVCDNRINFDEVIYDQEI
jgi:DNA-directed RNA polymerase subunit RPC12/RpoP